MDVQAPEHPIVSSWSIIDIRTPDMEVGGAKAPRGLTHDFLAANLDRIVDREAMAVTPIIIAGLIIRAVPVL